MTIAFYRLPLAWAALWVNSRTASRGEHDLACTTRTAASPAEKPLAPLPLHSNMGLARAVVNETLLHFSGDKRTNFTAFHLFGLDSPIPAAYISRALVFHAAGPPPDDGVSSI
jgi:hypothetical protein